MAYAMTKQGSLDNCITYEFICDTIADMNAIENRYRTIGSVAVVLEGEGGGMEAYIAGSNKQWNNLGSMGTSNSGSSSSTGGLSIHICTQDEVSNGLPNIQDPDETTIYLVSAGNESGNLYEEYIYANENWEKFGTGNVETNLPFIYDHQEETTLNFENINQYENNEVTIDDITVLREGPATLRVGSNTYSLEFEYYNDYDKVYSSVIDGDSDNGSINITIPSDTDATTNVQGTLYCSAYGDFDGPQNVSIIFPSVSDLISTANNLYIIGGREYKEKVATEHYVYNNYLSIDSANYNYVKQDAMDGKINKYYNFDFEPVYFKGMTAIQGDNIWTDGTNIYYSNFAVLNRESSTWEDLKMDRPDRYDYSFVKNIWTDGDNIYYSNSSSHYIWNKSKMTWDIKKWQGYTYITGQDVWTDGNNIYYSAGSPQYVLNKSTSTWETKSWNFALGTDMIYHLYGRYILNDGEHIYNYPSSNNLYILNENTWSKHSISNTPASFDHQYIWTDGDNIYYSKNSSSYILNKSNSSWETITWDNLTQLQGNKVWTDGINIYYSYGIDNQYVFNKSNSTWSQKEWYGLHPQFQGDGFWADGNNIYYSGGSGDQYILDKSTLTLTKKTWNILNNSLFAYYIWSDNENIYYSNGIQQYVFDKSNLTWNEKVWIGLNNFDGRDIWTDGEDFYYSAGTQNYILDKATSTWSEKNWEEINELYGRNIWTDGKYIYYSFGEYQYTFDKTDSYSNWYNTYHDTPFTIYGYNIWTDGEDIYYNDTKQYKLDQNTDNWYEIDDAPLTPFQISGLWKDGNDLYYTQGMVTYKLVRKNKVLLGVNGQYTPVSVQTFMKENSIIPAPPSTDGTYTLQATVASGVITYTWVAGA